MITFLTNKYALFAIVAIAIIAGIWYYGKLQYDDGYHVRDLSAQVEMQKLRADLLEVRDKELNRQMAANRQAQELQKQKIAELEIQNNSLESQLAENENEANTDDNRNRIGLDPSSVLRLNKIR